MKNYETEAAWHYHNGTKHPNGMLLNRFHTYHPSHRPNPYKIYKDVPTVSLPLDKNPSGADTLDVVSAAYDFETDMVPDLKTLSKILYFSAGITKKIKFPIPLGEMDFRAASCTGALYHIEIYVICTDISGLDAGVYHFDPKYMKLDTIRLGDFRKFVIDSTADEPAARHAPLILVFTDVFSRNSIKYQSREYRHAFWDCGTMLANTLAITATHKIPSKIVAGFVDAQMDTLLGLDSSTESSIAIVPIGKTSHVVPSCPPVSHVNTTDSSDYDISYPEISIMHDSSCLLTEIEVSAWRHPIAIEKKYSGKLIPLAKTIKSEEALEQTIIKRGSTRKFSLDSITFEEVSTILSQTTSGINTDFSFQGNHLSDIYIIANAVSGLESGSYHYIREKNALEQLRQGNFRHVSGNLGLDQDLSHDASVTIFFMSDLDVILDHFGNRGYRAAQMDAAIIGGKMYLAAYSLGLGATGLTFYDDMVTSFFSPSAKNKEVMFLIAIGKKEKSI